MARYSGPTLICLLLVALVSVLGCGSESAPVEGDEGGPPSTAGGGGTKDAALPVPGVSASGVSAPESDSGPPGSDSGASARAAAVFEWQDPEPPAAQALAEQVLTAAWNGDKTLAIEGSPTRLQMHMTTLEYPTSSIEGFGSQVVADATSLEDRLQKLGAEISDLEITIRLAGSILFDFDQSDIRVDAHKTLEEVAAVLTAYGDAPIRIEGHTDAIGSDAYNQTLSQARARAVAEWLVGAGLGAAQMQQLGHGETQPMATNDTVDGRQLNRRVEIVVERNPPAASGA